MADKPPELVTKPDTKTSGKDKDNFGSWVGFNAGKIGGDSFVFDGAGADASDVAKKMLDRTGLINYLRSVQGKPVPAKYWAVTSAKVDFMCASERDLRMRFRRRLENFDAKSGAAGALEQMVKNLSGVLAS